MGENFSSIAAFIWSVADLLRGDFKQSQYGRIHIAVYRFTSSGMRS